MERMVRKQVYIEPRQEEALKGMSAETGLSEAELIRRAVDGMLEHESEWVVRRAAWSRFIDSAKAEMTKGAIDGPGRDWTRDDLHDR